MTLDAKDVASLVRLQGEAQELKDRPAECRAHVLAEVSQLLRAELAFVTRCREHPTRPQLLEVAIHNLDGVSRPVWEVLSEQGGQFCPMAVEMQRRGARRMLVLSSNDLAERQIWSESPFYVDYVAKIGFDDVLSSSTLAATGNDLSISFLRERRWGRFRARDKLLLQMIDFGVGALVHFPDTKDGQTESPTSVAHGAPSPKLTPRVRATLDELLTGAADKEIAARLALSPYTVHQYVKVLLRAYGVTSRTELIAWHARGERARAVRRPSRTPGG